VSICSIDGLDAGQAHNVKHYSKLLDKTQLRMSPR